MQSFLDFEWIIVDDGSTDNTEEMVNRIIERHGKFPIRYIKTVNGGKHRAINRGVQEARGELFFIVDSDDYLLSEALEKINEVEQSIPCEEKKRFAGVCGLKGFSENKVVGSTFEGKYLDINTLERESHGIHGDKAEVFYTDIIKQYPFPEFENEKFLTECVVWDKIASDGYKMRFFNEIIYICNYLEDGLSAKYDRLLRDNPIGYGRYLSQRIKYGKITGINKWNKYLEYYYNNRNKFSFTSIAKYLDISAIKLYCGLLGMRIFYKVYDR